MIKLFFNGNVYIKLFVDQPLTKPLLARSDVLHTLCKCLQIQIISSTNCSTDFSFLVVNRRATTRCGPDCRISSSTPNNSCTDPNQSRCHLSFGCVSAQRDYNLGLSTQHPCGLCRIESSPLYFVQHFLFSEAFTARRMRACVCVCVCVCKNEEWREGSVDLSVGGAVLKIRRFLLLHFL